MFNQDPTEKEVATAIDSGLPENTLRMPKWFKKAGIGVATVAIVVGLAACSGETSDGAEGPEGSRNETSEVSAGGHDGAEGSEASEGAEGSEGSGQGEAAEAGHGGEGGNGEAAEGGVVNLLGPNDIYDETINGARLILKYDSATNAFVGSVENTTNGPLTRARVEVHLSNGTELGPTTPTDLAAGQVLNLSLPSSAAAFDTWSAHPEVGAAEGAEGSEGSSGEGSEGSEGGSGEGSEAAGHEGGSEGGSEGSGQAAAAGTGTNLSSTGISRGVHASQQLATADSYAGKLNDLEVAMVFDPAANAFIGRVKNEANEGLCNTTIGVVLDGNRRVQQSVLIPALDPSGRADFTIDAGNTSFTTWEIATDTFTCTATAAHGGEGAEAGGGESGTEGGNEGSGEGAGHESGSEGASEGGGEGAGHESGSEGASEGGGAEGGEEGGRAIPVDQAATGTYNNLDYNVRYDLADAAFVGVITNNTNQLVCGSKLEIHMAVGGQVIELGPTIPVDLAPGESMNVLLSSSPETPDAYSLHPESSPCP